MPPLSKSKTIYIDPFEHKLNAYSKNLNQILKTNGFNINSLKKNFDECINGSKKEIILLSWIEDKIVRKRWWRCLRKFFKIIKKIHILKRKGHILIWIRHNIKPHNIRTSSWVAKYCHKLLLLYIHKSIDARIVHSEQFSKENSGYHFLPHPLYLVHLSKNPIEFDGIIMGRIMRYKGITKTLSIWPQNRPLLIAGKCTEEGYLEEIKRIIAKRGLNVSIKEGYIEQKKLEDYLSISRSVIVSNEDKSMIASGVIVHALSAKKPVISTPTLISKEYSQKGYPVRIFKNRKELHQLLSENYECKKAFKHFETDHSDRNISSMFRKILESI